MKKSKVNSGYGWVPDRPDFRDKLYANIAAAPKVLPKKVDLRADCSRIEDQGQLGSCTANALVGNLEFLQRKQGHRVTNLSRLFIYYNEREMEGSVSEDAGAAIRDGVKSLVKLGVCTEPSWPYKIEKFAQKPPAKCYVNAGDHQATSYHRIVGLNQMRKCLAEGYPFVFGFSVYTSFESEEVAKTGKVEMPQLDEKNLGGHAVCAVGYDDSTKRFLVRNSWGKSWGNKGYFTMPYDYLANDDLSDDFWTLRAFENS